MQRRRVPGALHARPDLAAGSRARRLRRRPVPRRGLAGAHPGRRAGDATSTDWPRPWRRSTTVRAEAAVLIRPVSVAEIERTAREGLLMPPKSTFFTPKLKTGLRPAAAGLSARGT